MVLTKSGRREVKRSDYDSAEEVGARKRDGKTLGRQKDDGRG